MKRPADKPPRPPRLGESVGRLANLNAWIGQLGRTLDRKPYRARLIRLEGSCSVRAVKRGGPDGVVLPKSPQLAV
jgi:hypothetical protein